MIEEAESVVRHYGRPGVVQRLLYQPEAAGDER